MATVSKALRDGYKISVKTKLKVFGPKDLKVIIFSTTETAAILSPSLTTITQPAFEIGKKVAEILFKGIEKSDTAITEQFELLPSILVERQSTSKY